MPSIRNVLQSLMLSISLLRHVRTSVKPEWTDGDSVELERFLQSPTGKKMWVLLGQYYERKAVSACSSGGGEHQAGRVTGFREALAVIEFLSGSRQDEKIISLGNEAEAASSLYERYRP